MRLGQMAAMLFLVGCGISWLVNKVPAGADFPSIESVGYTDEPPKYEYRPWHKYTGMAALMLTVLVLVLVTAFTI